MSNKANIFYSHSDYKYEKAFDMATFKQKKTIFFPSFNLSLNVTLELGCQIFYKWKDSF